MLLRRGCDPESTMSCWRVRRRSERGAEIRVEGGEQWALGSRFCAGIEDDESNAHYVRILEAVIGALVWYVRGFGDNGQRLERDQVSGFKKLLSVFWRTHRYFCLHHRVSTASFASFHLHLTYTHRLCCLLRSLN